MDHHFWNEINAKTRFKLLKNTNEHQFLHLFFFTNSVTIQMKPLQQYFHMVIFL